MIIGPLLNLPVIPSSSGHLHDPEKRRAYQPWPRWNFPEAREVGFMAEKEHFFFYPMVKELDPHPLYKH